MRTKLLEIVLIVVGIGLLATYAGARTHGEVERRDALEAFDDRRTLEVGIPDQSAWSESRVAAYRDASAGIPLAVLRVPSAGIEVPVFSDTSERNLNRGAGAIEGTAAPGSNGNAGIAAHRDGHFRGLKDVVLGDEIEVEHQAGTRRYRITDLAVVEPTDVSSLYPTDEPALTLVTCYPFYFVGSAPQRYIVRAVAIN
ncbi:MAG: class D sortase [Gammaproteobacteria bacterium]